MSTKKVDVFGPIIMIINPSKEILDSVRQSCMQSKPSTDSDYEKRIPLFVRRCYRAIITGVLSPPKKLLQNVKYYLEAQAVNNGHQSSELS